MGKVKLDRIYNTIPSLATTNIEVTAVSIPYPKLLEETVRDNVAAEIRRQLGLPMHYIRDNIKVRYNSNDPREVIVLDDDIRNTLRDIRYIIGCSDKVTYRLLFRLILKTLRAERKIIGHQIISGVVQIERDENVKN